MTRRFSTGSTELDAYLGGLHPGDSVLFLQAAPRASLPLWRLFIDRVRTENHSLIYLSLSGSRSYLLAGVDHKVVPIRQSNRKSGLFSKNLILKSLRSAPDGSILILDDLAEWKEGGTGGVGANDILEITASWAVRRKGLIFGTCATSAFHPDALARMKETVTVCLDVAHSEDSLILSPLKLTGRFPAGGPYPFGFRIQRPGQGKTGRAVPLRDFASSHGERVRLDFRLREETATELFSGPLGQTGMGLALADLHGSFVAVNSALKKMLGFRGPSEENQEGDSSSVFVERFLSPQMLSPGGKRQILRFIARVRREGKGVIRMTARPAGGSPSGFRVSASALSAGLTLFLVEDQAIETQSDSSLQMSVAARVLACRADRKKVTWMSPALHSLIGATAKAGIHHTLSSRFDTRTTRAIRDGMEAVDSGETTLPINGILQRTAGVPIPVRITVDRDREDQQVYFLTIADVSEYVSRIATLETLDRLYRSVTEHISRPVVLLDGLTIVYGNPAFQELTGRMEGPSAHPATIDQCVEEVGRNQLTEAFRKFLASRHTRGSFEATFTRRGEASIRARLLARKIQGITGIGAVLEVEDVTEMRQEADRLSGLHDGVERITSILEAATAVPDHDRLLQVALDRSLEILNWDGGGVFLRSRSGATFDLALTKHLPKKLASGIASLPIDEGLGGFVAKTLESQILTLSRYPSYLPYGSLFRELGLKQISLVPLVNAGEATGFILGYSRGDGSTGESSLETLTTLGRQLGNALANARRLQTVRESESRLHTVVESLAGIVYTAGPDGTILTIDAAVTSALGYTPRDFARNKSLFLSLIHESDKKIYLERVTGGELLGPGFVREYRMRPKAKAAFRWMRDTASVMRDPEGGVTGFTGILADVTSEREQLDAVRSEQAILRTVQDSLPEGIAVFDDGGLCIEWNPEMERITGMTRAAATGRTAESLVPLPASLGEEGFRAAILSRKPARLGMITPPSQPGSRYEVFLVAVPGRGDAAPGFLLRFADVTSRQAELETLLESEKILLNVINAMDDVMMITDLGGRVVEVNQAFLKVMRYPRSAAVGKEFPYPWLVERDMSRFLQWTSAIRERQWLHDFDVTWITRTGEELQMSLNTTLIRNSLGEPVAMLNIARDISERARLARDVEARTRQMEMINRIVTVASASDDFPPVFREAADEIVRSMPAHAVCTVSLQGPADPWSQAAAFDGEALSREEAVSLAAAMFPGGPAIASDAIVGDFGRAPAERRPAGSAGRFKSAVALPIGEPGRADACLIVASRDPYAFGEDHAARLRPLAIQLGVIIDRIRLFRQVLSDSSFVAGLLDSIPSPVYTLAPDLTITRVNRAAGEFLRARMGESRTTLVGATVRELLPASPLSGALEMVLSRLRGGTRDHASEEVALQGTTGPVNVRVTVSPLGGAGGSTGYVVSHADITTLKAGERELRERAEQLTTLHEISVVVSQTLDVDAVLASSLPLLRDALGARGIIVYLAHPQTGELHLGHQVGFGSESVREVARLDPARSITGDVIARRTPSYVDSGIASDQRIAPENRRFLEQNGVQAMAVVPILSRNSVLGALDIFYDVAHEFPDREKHLLNLAGNQLGAAIVNVRLYGELRAQVDRLSALFDLSRRLTSLLDTSEICRATFDNIRRVVPCERCTIGVVPDPGGQLTPVLTAERTGEGFTITDRPTAVEEPVAGALSEVLRSGSTRTVDGGRTVVVPMASDALTSGAIVVTRSDGSPFDEVQARLLESFGSLAAIALQKAGLYEETVRTNEKIELRNRELDDFTYVVSHDLKEPLISIEGFSRILRMDYAEVIGPEGRDYLESLVGAATRMKGLIDDLLMLSRVSRPAESFDDVELEPIVREVKADMEFLIRKRNVDFRIAAGLPRVRGNATQLAILFRNLVGNAIKFNDKPDPFVEVGFHNQGNNSYLFSVKDNGIGIDPEFFEKIFVIFQRLHRREEYEGSGAGLAIARKIIEMHEGTLWVESKKGEGSTFFFTLPAAPAA